MGFLIRDCVRCGVAKVQMRIHGSTWYTASNQEMFAVCQACGRGSIYDGQPNFDPVKSDMDIDSSGRYISTTPVQVSFPSPNISPDVPNRVADLFKEAAKARQMCLYEASGAIFRKTIDVATKHLFQHDQRLAGRNPADALRVRIKALGEMKILDEDIVELADVVALDGNDAVHDIDPYTSEEAEALEDLTSDLLDRLFVRPARVAAVKAKQLAAGQRK